MLSRSKILLGILLFLLVTIFIALLSLESYLAQEITEILNDEAEEACTDCHFYAEDLDVSILTFSATAKNAEIRQKNKTYLSFKKIKLTVGLQEIFKKKIILERIDLIDGYTEGIGIYSPTFHYIDQLSTSPPPSSKPSQEQKKKKWHVRLNELRVINLDGNQKFLGQEVDFHNIAVKLYRNDSDDFELIPSIEKITLVNKLQPNLLLAKGNGHLYFLDDGKSNVELNPFHLENNLSHATIKASFLDNNDILGGLNSSLYSTDFLPSPYDFKLKVKTDFSYLGEDLKLTTDINLDTKQKNSIQIFDEKINIKDLTSSWLYQFDRTNTLLSLKKLNLTADKLTAQVTKQINWSDKLDGELLVNLKEFNYQDIQLKDITLRLHPEGSSDQPKFKLSGVAGEVNIHENKLSNISFSTENLSALKEIKFWHNSPELGKLDATVSLTDQIVNKVTVNFQEFKFQPKQIEYLDHLSLDGSAKFDLQEHWEGTGQLKLSSKHFTGEASLNSKFILDKEALKVDLKNESESISASLDYNLNNSKSTLNLNLSSFKLKEYNPNIRCSNVTLSILYQFEANQLLTGDGQLNLNQLSLGCEPYVLKTTQANNFQINLGKIDPLTLDLESNNNNFQITGHVSLAGGGRLETKGNINLNSFLPAFYFLDEIKGNIFIDSIVDINQYQPKITGEIILTDLDFFSSEFDLIGSDFSGNLLIDQNIFSTNDLTGKINSSPIFISSEVDLNNTESSILNVEFDNLEINPENHLNISTSGKLTYSHSDGTDSIHGHINLNEAIYSREFGINKLSNLFGNLFTQSPTEQISENNLPAIPVDIEIDARRNLFILTDLLEAELKANLHLTGKLNNLDIRGKINTIYGSLGLNNSKFEITKAEVDFNPELEVPLLTLQAGTTVYNRFGEATYVNMLADGSINNIDLNLSTDNNLSEQQILTLLTTRGQFSTGSSNNGIQKSLFKSQIEDNLFDNLINKLTTLDSIRIEPAYSQRTGLIEPSIIAEKNITEDFTLSSQSFISGNSNDSKFKANYSLNSFFGLSGLINTGSIGGNTALEANFNVKVLNKENYNVNYNFDNQSNFSDREILSLLLINRKSILLENDVSNLELKLKTILSDKGYYNPKVKIQCLDLQEYCHTIDFIIPELSTSEIKSIILTQTLPNNLSLDYRSSVGKRASQANLKSICKQTTLEFRNQGYLSAIVKCNYFENQQQERAVGIQFDSGKAISLIFEGNKLFSDEDLVKKLGLLTSRFPITRNSISKIVTNIEKLYRQNGYLLAEIKLDNIELNTNRTSYFIKITENNKIKIAKPNITGITSKQLFNLKKYLKESTPKDYSAIFEARHLVDEEISVALISIKKYFNNLGYINTTINSDILSISDNQFQLLLEIQLAQKQTIKIAKIITAQSIVNFDNLLNKDIPINKIKQTTQQINNHLKNSGFLEFTITSQETANNIIFEVENLKSNLINSISCEGNKQISCQKIINLSKLKLKQIISSQSFSKARANLFRSNLFNEVELLTKEVANQKYQKNLIIKVRENNLTNLNLGAGLNSELGFHIFSEATDYQIFKDGRSLNLRLDSYFDETTKETTQGIISLRYRDPDLFNHDFSYNSEIIFQKYNNPTLEFDLDRVALDNSILKNWNKLLTTTFGYTISQENLDNVTDGAALSKLDQGRINLSYLYGNFNLDYSNIIDFRFSLDYKLSNQAILSDANFYSLGGKFSMIYNLPNANWSIANLTNFSRSHTFGNTSQIPISQRFYLGGRNSIRGFKENSLGPRGKDNAVIGGNILFSNNFELRYKINPEFQIHSFLDIGNIYLDKFELSPSKLRESVGLGFRYLSPIGPIGLDIGHALDRESGEPSSRVHFAVGSNF